MGLSVRERGETVATLRWIHVRLMETIASWIPTTPEMEIKLAFGTHVWDLAQHADALGKRTYELRMPLQHSLPPSDAYQAYLAGIAAITDSAERVAAFYDAVLPALARRYADYLSRTDQLLDAPTVRIFKHIAAEQARMIGEGDDLRRELANLPAAPRALADGLKQQEQAIADFVVHRDEKTEAGAA
ncbi:MAG TPA: hypothetical protein VMU08_14060 [Rhizomicrobium sp.]|nr:hypothetical protein [Rhizomicrobium sp.]